MLEPDSGTIYLDGTDIKTYTRESCWKLFSAVFQDFQMFALPIGENIAGSTIYSQERIMKSLNDCGMGDWIKRQNKGLNQELFRVNEDGINVSGGESQKLAIARALYFNRPFIIMDEPHLIRFQNRKSMKNFICWQKEKVQFIYHIASLPAVSAIKFMCLIMGN